MALFIDTVTIYNKISGNEWKRTVVNGVQWVDKNDKTSTDRVIGIARYASVTFPEGTYEELVINALNEEDCIVYGAVEDVVTGSRGQRICDLMEKYQKSGTIKAVNDNSNRDFLKNIKVIVA